MENTSQELMSAWFRKTAELTEATLRITAQAQLANLDRWMEGMAHVGAEAAQELPSVPEMSEGERRLAGFGEKTERQSASAVDDQVPAAGVERRQATPPIRHKSARTVAARSSKAGHKRNSEKARASSSSVKGGRSRSRAKASRR